MVSHYIFYGILFFGAYFGFWTALLHGAENHPYMGESWIIKQARDRERNKRA